MQLYLVVYVSHSYLPIIRSHVRQCVCHNRCWYKQMFICGINTGISKPLRPGFGFKARDGTHLPPPHTHSAMLYLYVGNGNGLSHCWLECWNLLLCCYLLMWIVGCVKFTGFLTMLWICLKCLSSTYRYIVVILFKIWFFSEHTWCLHCHYILIYDIYSQTDHHHMYSASLVSSAVISLQLSPEY